MASAFDNRLNELTRNLGTGPASSDPVYRETLDLFSPPPPPPAPDLSGFAKPPGGPDLSGFAQPPSEPPVAALEEGATVWDRLKSAGASAIQSGVGTIADIPKNITVTFAGRRAELNSTFNQIDRLAPGAEPPKFSGIYSKVYDKYLNATPEQRLEIRNRVGEDYDPRTTKFYQFGESLDEAISQAVPTDPRFQGEFWADQLPAGIGSTVGFLTTGLIGRFLKLPAAVGAAGSGAAVEGQQQFEQALDAGASLTDAYRASNLGHYTGMTEAVPILTFLDRFDTVTGGSIKRGLKRVIAQGTEEAIQEFVQGVGGNLIANRWVKYDPDRGTFEGVGEATGVGFSVGALMETLTLLAFGGRRARSGPPPGGQPSGQAQPPAAGPPPGGPEPEIIPPNPFEPRQPAGPGIEEEIEEAQIVPEGALPAPPRQLEGPAAGSPPPATVDQGPSAPVEPAPSVAAPAQLPPPDAATAPQTPALPVAAPQQPQDQNAAPGPAIALPDLSQFSEPPAGGAPETEPQPQALPDGRVPVAQTTMQADDANEEVTVSLVAEGPWDFNDTFPAPDPKAQEGMTQEGRWEFPDSGPDLAEAVAATFDESLNELQSYIGDRAILAAQIRDARAGQGKPPKRGMSRETWIKQLTGAYEARGRDIADLTAVYQDIFGEVASRAMLREARVRARNERAQTAQGLPEVQAARGASAAEEVAQAQEQPTPPTGETVEESAREAAEKPTKTRKRKPTKQAGPVSLLRFLGSIGGIKDHKGELAALDLTKLFVPGVGRLVRKNGVPLDRARELAAEAGYLTHLYGSRDRAIAESTPADLLDLIDEETRGNKIYPAGDEAAVADKRAAEQQDQARDLATQDVDAFLDEFEITDVDERVRQETINIRMQGLTVDDAFDQAVMGVEYNELTPAEADQAEETIPGWEDGPETAPQSRETVGPARPDREPGEAARDNAPRQEPAPRREGERAAQTDRITGRSPGSWVVVDKTTGKSVRELFTKDAADAVNRERYDVVPAGEYLVSLNKPQTERTEAGEQGVLIERDSDADVARRRASAPMRGKVAQDLTMDEGLFGDSSQQTDLVDMSRAAKRKEEKPAPRKGEVGMKMSAGEVVQTVTGRNTTPFPKLSFGTDRKTGNTIRRVDKWLMENALAEAQSRGDDFNARMFESNIEKPSPADKDSAEFYLFDPDSVQPVPKSILKDLTPATKPESDYGSKNRLVNKDRAEAARKLLRDKFKNQLSAGIDPEVLAAGIELSVFHIEAGARKFVDFARAVTADLGITIDQARPYLRAWYNGARDMMEDAGADVAGMDSADHVREAVKTVGNDDVSSQRADLERDRQGRPAADQDGQTALPPERSGPGPSAGERGSAAGGAGQRAGSRGVSDRSAPVVGEGGNLELPEKQPGERPSPAGASERERGGAVGGEGLPDDRPDAPAIAPDATERADLKARRAAQAAAESIPIKPGIENIRETLPLLFPEQQQDVADVEARFAKPDGHGMLITNGTGTGKTFSGLGVIKRFVRQGKKNVLVVAPSQGVLNSWKAAAKSFGIDMHVLESTQDRGRGVSATTYANLGDNAELVNTSWDLVVADESHKLSSDSNGTVTKALDTFRALTLHPDGLYHRARQVFKREYEEAQRLYEVARKTKDPDRWKAAQAAYDAKATPAMKEWQQQDRPKALMLSATPFAYHFSLDAAAGYLFEFDSSEGGSGYNVATGRDAFYVQNFGFRMRYNKLTKPDADVNLEVMEREFHEKLRREGSLIGRALEVDKDYDRKFILVDDAIGTRIDDALEFLRTEKDQRFRYLYDAISKRFDYLSRMRLLEAIKAKAAIPYIKDSLALGRKVVVFHDYNEGGGFNPFDLSFADDDVRSYTEYGADGKSRVVEFKPAEAYRDFLDRAPYVKNLKFSDYRAPIAELTAAFPDALVYNGTVSNKKRDEALRLFNDDDSGRNLVIVQSAAGEFGLTMNDQTGANQRVLLNLGMPIRPTSAIQQEGRIYRVGQATDALFRYMNTGTAWERWTFAGKIAERSGTAENLALGEQARAIRQSFTDAFEEADDYPPGPGEGRGGKAIDRANYDLSPFERAKTFYFGQQKVSKRRDQREGADYFATPEPLGLKMVEWANVKPNERILEPSAGHGAIARFFPEDAHRTIVEPSGTLASRAALAAPGARAIAGRFEDLNLVNKYDAIVMNPPFGSGGRTAVDHLDKATKHLANGGRVVAILPRGPAADAKFDKWYEGVKNIYKVADINLPAVTFERAGTKVATRIVVLDKYTDAETTPPQNVTRDYSNAETIKEFFDRIEDGSIPYRVEPATKEPVEPDRPAAAPVAGARFDKVKAYHAKKGIDLFVATLKGRVDGDTFKAVREAAKRHGGYYSSYRGAGAVPGFQFEAEAQRDAFVAEVEPPTPESSASLSVAPVFYSTVLRTVEESSLNKAAPAQWMGMLRKARGVKQEELDWIGLEDWLNDQSEAGKPRAVSRDELAEFIRANQIEVRDVVKGGATGDDAIARLVGEYDAWRAERKFVSMSSDELMAELRWAEGRGSDAELSETYGRTRDELIDDIDWLEDFGNRWRQVEEAGDDQTQYESYTLPGGEGNTELLLTLRAREYPQENRIEELSRAINEARDAGNQERVNELIAERVPLIAKRTEFDRNKVSNQYESAHFQEPNIIVHVRFKTRLVDIPWTAEERATLDRIAEMTPEFERVTADRDAAVREARAERAPQYAAIKDEVTEDVRAGRVRLADWEVEVQRRIEALPDTPAMKRMQDAEARRQWPPTAPKRRQQRVLAIEEIQSDWHQAGRKRGYRDKKITELPEGTKREKSSATQAMLKVPGEPGGAGFAGFEVRWNAATGLDWAAAEQQALDWLNRRGVPDAPFKTSWHELALKRMIRWAAENDYDQIAWTPGIEQVKRYETATRQAVLRIDWQPYTERKGWDDWKTVIVQPASSESNYTFQISPDGIVRASSVQNVGGETVEDLFGKEMARRIMAEPSGRIEGDNLVIGGKGMIDFYDKILVNAANKLGKKFGAKVGSTTIDASDRPWIVKKFMRAADTVHDMARFETESAARAHAEGLGDGAFVERDPNARVDFHTLPITDAMREAAMQGQPLFQRKTGSYSARIKNRKRLENDIRSIVARIAGQRVNVILPEQISIDSLSNVADLDQVRAAYEAAGLVPPEFAEGYRHPNVDGAELIAIAMQGHDPRGTAGHEAWHSVQNMLTQQEQRIIAADLARGDGSWLRRLAARERPNERMDKMPDAEVEAYAFQQYRRAREEGNAGEIRLHIAIRRAFDKLIRIFEAVRAYITRNNDPTVRSIFEAARRGDIAREYEEQNPDLNQAIVEATEDAAEQRAEAREARIQAALRPRRVARAPRSTAYNQVRSRLGTEKRNWDVSWNKLYEQYKDELDPVRRIRDFGLEAIGAGGRQLRAEKDPFVLARLARGTHGMALHWLQHSPFRYDFHPDQGHQDVGKSLREILAPVDDDIEAFEVYAVAKRAVEKNRQGIRTGIDDRAARQVVAAGRTQYEPVLRELIEYQDHLLQYLIDAGILDRAKAGAFRAANRDYVPFYRLMNEEFGPAAGIGHNRQARNPIRRMKGSDRQIVWPIESIVRNTFLYIDLAEINRIHRAHVDFATEVARADPDAGKEMAEKLKIPVSPTQVTDPEIRRFMRDAGLNPNNYAGGTDFTIFRPTSFNPKPDQIAPFRNGKRELWRVPEEVGRALKSLNRERQNILIRLLGTPARLLRAGATLAPEFAIRNPIRDQFTAFTNSDSGYLPFVHMIDGLGRVMLKDRKYREWLKMGGANAAMVSMDRNYINESLVRMSDPAFHRRVQHALMTPISLLRAFSELTENATRVGEYAQARRQGWEIRGGRPQRRPAASAARAAFRAREVSLDFARLGSKGATINQLIAFWNAGVEGNDRLVRAAWNHPIRTLFRLLVAITIPSILLWMDNKDDPRWKELPLWQRDLFWIIFTDDWQTAKNGAELAAYKDAGLAREIDGEWQINKGNTWRIPKPFGLGVMFGSVPERILDAFVADEPHAFDGLVESVGLAFTPAYMPVVLIPFMEQFANWQMFLDRPIISRSQEGIDPDLQYSDYTTDTAKLIGKALSFIPGVKDTTTPSPSIIENYIYAWTGGLGRYAMQISDLALRATGVTQDSVEVRPSPTMADLPLIRAFAVRHPSANTRSIVQFYENYDAEYQKSRTFDYLRRSGRADEAREREPGMVRGLFGTDGALGSFAQALSNQRKVIRNIYENPNISRDDKRTQIDAIYMQMTAIAQRANEFYDMEMARRAN